MRRCGEGVKARTATLCGVLVSSTCTPYCGATMYACDFCGLVIMSLLLCNMLIMTHIYSCVCGQNPTTREVARCVAKALV